MYSLDLNIQTALDRRAELIQAVQNDTGTHSDEPTSQPARSVWSLVLIAVAAAIGLALWHHPSASL